MMGVMKNIISVYRLTSFIKQITFFKNPKNASRINLILTKKTLIFSMYVCYIRFSQNDYFYPKSSLLEAVVKSYQMQKFRKSNHEKFIISLQLAVNSQNYIFDEETQKIFDIYLLNHHTPIKKYLQGIINQL